MCIEVARKDAAVTLCLLSLLNVRFKGHIFCYVFVRIYSVSGGLLTINDLFNIALSVATNATLYSLSVRRFKFLQTLMQTY